MISKVSFTDNKNKIVSVEDLIIKEIYDTDAVYISWFTNFACELFTQLKEFR